uniref:NADH-ubiquinone oxidoreductase chain 2 n=1 Tax=Cucujoidea sp. 38 KM-2017 TaxID=2219376 RepID=A0A346RHS4_9CUCU|nr:NADH dehydrogenase subunit 2 [Cucujoidea sp. 38 KM-2017]
MKFYKLIFTLTLMLGTMITISANSWFSMWIGLEINLVSIIPLLKTHNNMLSSEASIKYFVTQALASTLILFSIISIQLMEINYFISQAFSLSLDSALLTKMGAAPFHFWFPEVLEGLTWINCLIMLTWQKIAPMIIIMFNSYLTMMMIIVILISMTISSIMGFNQMSLRKIMAFSSINNIGWMLSIMFISQSIWLIYFCIYSIITISIIQIFNMFNLFYLNQFLNYFSNAPMTKLFLSLNFMSLGGLPPFLGFLPKWLTINELIENNFFWLTFFMIILTLIMLYIYIRIMFSSTLIISNKSKNNSSNMNFWSMFFNFLSIFSLILYSLVFTLS